MWSGASTAIPTGWALCNGANGTPDLRNRFIVGAGSTYAVGDKGGSDSVALTIEQMPSHEHTIRASNGYSTYDVAASGREGTGSTGVLELLSSGSYSLAKAASVGSGKSHENRPPYYALCFIMKL